LCLAALAHASCESHRGPGPGTGGQDGADTGGAGGAGHAGSGGGGGTGGAAPVVADAAAPPAPDAAAALDVTAAPDGPPDAGAILASCPEILAAASDFISSLDAAGKARAVMPFEQRKQYRFTPGGERPGLVLQDMTELQRAKALALLKATLSDSGYQKAMNIRVMDNWLKANVGGFPFGELLYYVAIYGTPSPAGNWAWHWEGHHCSLHFTFVGCTRAATAPAMFGVEPANLPAAFQGLPAGTRVLGKQTDLAHALAMMLAADPQKRAMAIAAKGGRAVPNTPDKQAPVLPAGLPASMMSPAEAARLGELLDEIIGNMKPDLAAIRRQRLDEAGRDKISFLWIGPLALNVDTAYYFRIQGPTFIFEHNIEWANHIHSAWRDFDGDFGEDLLLQHLRMYPHRSAALFDR
jgi:hypothetical protein